MKRFLATILFLGLFLGLGTVAAVADGADGGDRVIVKPNAAHKFATLPEAAAFPEGITANPANGDIYVATFNFAGDNFVMRFRKSGRLVAIRNFGATPLLGIAFNRRDRKIYIANTGALVGDPGGSRIQRIDARFDASTLIEEVAPIPSIGAPGDRTVDNPDDSHDVIEFGNNAAAPNALAFDAAGKLYVSDSFQGAIFSIPNPAVDCPNGRACTVDTVIHDPLLATAGFPSFGANGLALNADESALFVANTGDDRILELDLKSLDLSVFAESLNGADGIAFDRSGRLWVAANQADRVTALDEHGRVVAEFGAFLGVRADGAARGLLFPASVVIVGHKLFVTNLALPLTGAAGDEPEEDVTTYTVSQINLPPDHD